MDKIETKAFRAIPVTPRFLLNLNADGAVLQRMDTSRHKMLKLKMKLGLGLWSVI